MLQSCLPCASDLFLSLHAAFVACSRVTAMSHLAVGVLGLGPLSLMKLCQGEFDPYFRNRGTATRVYTFALPAWAYVGAVVLCLHVACSGIRTTKVPGCQVLPQASCYRLRFCTHVRWLPLLLKRGFMRCPVHLGAAGTVTKLVS